MVSLTILLITAVLFGLRHGIDWDHLAAIADISGSAVTTREGWWYGTLYALGHAMVILVLGFAAVLFGLKLPAWVDRVMEPIVGTTLIILGLWLIVAVLTQGKSFRLKSRWMLLFELYKKVHRHPAVSKNTGEKLAPSGAILVGVVHGIGAETPTQLLLFITLSRAGGAVAGIALVLSFVVGLLVSNSILIAVSLLGLTRLDKSSPWYLGLGVVSGFFSLIVGFLFLTGKNGLLPAFFGG